MKKLGILRETKNKWEGRVAQNPEAVKSPRDHPTRALYIERKRSDHRAPSPSSTTSATSRDHQRSFYIRMGFPSI